MNKNPYSLAFGTEPAEIIPRLAQSSEIIQEFTDESPSQTIYMVTGIRGSGKTVFMTTIAEHFRTLDDWIVVDLNPERDLLENLASKLSSRNELARIFQTAKINLSFFGFGLEVSGAAPITDIEVALEKMLASLKDKGRRVLLCIDEVTATQNMKVFAASYQIFIRQKLPVFLIMTGLYENIYELQNEKTLTFLYRAPKIALKSLSLSTIADNYASVFELDTAGAAAMARLTRGYAFAFQVLGYLTWKHGYGSKKIMTEYRQYLEEYVYEKIWSGLSATDKRVLYGAAKVPDGKIREIRELLHMTTNSFNPYRKRLIMKGLIDGSEYGRILFTLPLFEEYVLANFEGSL